MEVHMRYKCKDVFMIRKPMGSIEGYIRVLRDELDCDQVLELYESLDIKDLLEEGLLISSKDFYESTQLIGQLEVGTKQYKNISSSLLKYIVRAKTRPTPYGMFSSVGLGEFEEFSQEKSIIVSSKENKKVIRVDINWLCKLVKKIESDSDILIKLKVKFNNICYGFGDRIKNPYFSNFGDIARTNDYIESNNIRRTKLVDLIKANTFNFIGVKDLIEIVKDAYKDVPYELVFQAIEHLVENEYLLTDLRLPAYCNDELDYLITTLGEIGFNQTNKLIELRELFCMYRDSFDSKQSVEILNRIYAIMQNLQESSNYIMVDSGMQFCKNKLPITVKNKIENFCNKFAGIYLDNKNYSKLDTFIEKFIETYGVNVEVPLKEIIDENGFNGLSYINFSVKDIDDRERQIRKIVDEKILLALMNQQECVELLSEDFEKISQVGEANTILSFDINFYITESNNEYLLSIGPNVGSSKGGAMFQRFEQVFDHDLFQKYKSIYKDELELAKDNYLLVEARELSIRGRSNNVMNKNKNYEYCFPIGLSCDSSDKVITTEDLYIGVNENGKVYIKSKEFNRICKFIYDNMLNINSNGKLLFFLREVSNMYENKVLDRVEILHSNQYVYSPQIKFEDVVVSPRQWIFTQQHLEGRNFDEFKKDFEKSVEIYKVDKWVYLVEYDNRLIVNINNDIYLRWIYLYFKHTKKIHLCALEEGLLNGSILIDEQGNRYISEMVFSLIKDVNKPSNNDVSKAYDLQLSLIEDENRNVAPFKDGWVYFKIYINGKKTNDVLKGVEQFTKENAVEFFYLRYHDSEGAHLRIRLKFSSRKEALNKIESVCDKLENYKKHRVISKWLIDEYSKEVNRYGGAALINDIENVFFIDSVFCINLLKQFDLEQEEDIEKSYLIGLTHLLKNLCENEKDMLEILDCLNCKKLHREEFNMKRKQYIDLISKLLSNENVGRESLQRNLV